MDPLAESVKESCGNRLVAQSSSNNFGKLRWQQAVRTMIAFFKVGCGVTQSPPRGSSVIMFHSFASLRHTYNTLQSCSVVPVYAET